MISTLLYIISVTYGHKDNNGPRSLHHQLSDLLCLIIHHVIHSDKVT